jgi:hypothetical protein
MINHLSDTYYTDFPLTFHKFVKANPSFLKSEFNMDGNNLEYNRNVWWKSDTGNTTYKQDLYMFTITNVKTYYTILIHLHIGLQNILQSLMHADEFNNVLFECAWHLHDVSNVNLYPGVTYVCFPRRCNTVSCRVAAALFSLEGKTWSPQVSTELHPWP